MVNQYDKPYTNKRHWATSARSNWWLRSVNSASNAANVNNNGNANNNSAANVNGVRPRFLTSFL